MHARPPRFFVGRAKTGRARCRRCQRPIAKGSPVLGIVANVTPRHTVLRYVHAGEGADGCVRYALPRPGQGSLEGVQRGVDATALAACLAPALSDARGEGLEPPPPAAASRTR